MRRRAFLGSLGAGMAAPRLFADQKVTGGNGTFYVGGRPDRIVIVDEATEKATGEIKMRMGAPYRLRATRDRKRIYAIDMSFENVEIVDLATRQVIDTFRLSEGSKKVRIRGIEVDPAHRTAMLLTKTVTKAIDHWEIGPMTILQYDMQDHKVIRTLPWPNNEEREFAGFKFSPDGKFLFLFGEDIVAFDTKDFKEVDKWELSQPIENGFGRINLGSLDDTYEEPGYYSGIFTVQDAVQHRKIMGIARVNLQQKKVDFYALGPAEGVEFALAPGRELAYGLREEVGRCEFWTFDLKNKRLKSRTQFDGRPRMALKSSTNGKLLYVYQAGPTIDLYEAATYKYLRTITLNIDMTGLVIVPAQA